MKKFIALFMASILCISICACNNASSTSELSKEEIAEQAEELEMSDLMYEISNNLARAKELYNDKLIKINNFKIYSINSYKDYATISMNYWYKNTVMIIDAKIPKEEALLINKNDTVTVVGNININFESMAHLNDAHIIISSN